ncbi:MAG: LPS export ABC transporter periplasmic protein LptC [Rhodothermales bacterium]|nr:LPS export ABC transporter periplasmic protein LptC [Rhodothermales bacterium]
MKLILVSTLIAVSAASAGCFDRQERPVGETPQLPTTPVPSQESFDVELYESADGALRYRIRAAYMGRYETADSSFVLLAKRTPEDAPVRAELFGSNPDSTTTIDAAEIRFFETDHRFEARGNVVVLTSTGRRLETEFLVWREDDRRVNAPGFVRIISSTEDMQGYGFDSDEQLNSFSLQRVTGRYYLEEE